MPYPKSLQKQEEISMMVEFESFLFKYVHIIIPILFVILLILIIATIIAIVDISSAHNQTIVMVESGNYYNHLKDVI